MYYYFVNHTPCKTKAKRNELKEISEEQYNTLIDAINNFNLTAPDGQYYRLEIDGTWKLYELPVNNEATTEDLYNALAELGVE